MKVIHGIEVDAKNDKISQYKINQPNLDVLKYIKGGNNPRQKLGNKYIPLKREILIRKTLF